MSNYIVYEVYYNSELVYIGSGKEGREQHVKSGKSHSIELNKLFFDDPNNIDVVIIREGLEKRESLDMEKDYIYASQPKFNIKHTSKVRLNKHLPHFY